MSTETQIAEASHTTLSKKTKVDIAVSKQGKCLIAYGIPFDLDKIPSWIEFDKLNKTLNFHTEEGLSIPLGRKLNQKISKDLESADSATMVCLLNGKIAQKLSAPIITSGGGV